MNNARSARIIVVSPFSPFPPYWGGASRTFNLVKHLNNHLDVTLLYNDLSHIHDSRGSARYTSMLREDGVRVVGVRSYSRLSQIFNPFLTWRMLLEIKRLKTDAILIEFPWQGFACLLVSRIAGLPMIVDEHNAEFLRFERMGKGTKMTRRLLHWYESIVTRSVERVYCVSDVDRRVIESEFAVDRSRTMIVQNGVDGSVFENLGVDRATIRKRLGVGSKDPLFLFHGKLDYLSNLEALGNILNEIVPRLAKDVPSAKIVVAGDNPPKSMIGVDRLVVTGVVPDLPDLIRACDAVICPLASGGGTRIKIIEAIFCNTPVVSTTIGAEGLDTDKLGGLVRIADDWDDFVKKMEECIGSVETGGSSPIESLEEYDWRSIGRVVADDIKSLIGH